MARLIVALSGHVGSGKTTLGEFLHNRFGAHCFKTKDYLRTRHPGTAAERGAMQALGESLDRKTGGHWVTDGLTRNIQADQVSEDAIVIVDAIRRKSQLTALRKGYGPMVVHIHLHASDRELARRYGRRHVSGFQEFKSYANVQENVTESRVGQLHDSADIVIDTERCTAEDVMVKAASFLGLYGRENLRLVDVVVGGQYGSEGKGHMCSFLAREYDVLVRVGGPNAGHKVFRRPRPVTFHQLPSGVASAVRAKLVIGAGATIYVPDLLAEINQNDVDCDRLAIDPQTMVIIDKDRSREQKLVDGIGSTGCGGGAANARRISGRLPGTVKLARDYPELRPYVRNTCELLEDAFRERQKVLLEGTQGTGLSLYHGHYPHVTSRDTTVAGCLAEAGISPSRVRKVIMVCRTYPIRVQDPSGGTSGPMREIAWAEVERRAGFGRNAIRRKELGSTSHRQRRVGEFEWVALRKAATLNAPTDIALTFADYLTKKNEEARRFEQLEAATLRFIGDVERVAGAPVSLISTRFDHPNRSIIDRRAW